MSAARCCWCRSSRSRRTPAPACHPLHPGGGAREARRLFDYALTRTRTHPLRVECGEFGADMQVALIDDGPVTFSLRVAPDN